MDQNGSGGLLIFQETQPGYGKVPIGPIFKVFNLSFPVRLLNKAPYIVIWIGLCKMTAMMKFFDTAISDLAHK